MVLVTFFFAMNAAVCLTVVVNAYLLFAVDGGHTDIVICSYIDFNRTLCCMVNISFIIVVSFCLQQVSPHVG